MTKEEYKAEITSIDSQIAALQIKKGEARAQFIIENSHFNIGDKVAVIWEANSDWNKKQVPEKRVVVFVSKIEDKYFTGEIRYDFVKVKKDGTMSAQSAGLYGYKRIELIEKSKPE